MVKQHLVMAAVATVAAIVLPLMMRSMGGNGDHPQPDHTGHDRHGEERTRAGQP